MRGSNARVYIGGMLFCTARYVEIVTEQALHEVYECFSSEPTAIVKGKKKYKTTLESIVVKDMDKALDFIALDDFTVKLVVDGKIIILDGCVWSSDNIKIEADSVIKRLSFSALNRWESEE